MIIAAGKCNWRPIALSSFFFLQSFFGERKRQCEVVHQIENQYLKQVNLC